jgi:hypothetical protein
VESRALPRILYVSDVPVELSYAGATLIYRLFEHYPADRLFVVQPVNLDPTRRLRGVKYYILGSRLLDRLRFSRFSRQLAWLNIAFQFMPGLNLKKRIESFKPEAIVTVTFRTSWLRAWRLSQKLNVPLHLILHDDWLTTENYGVWQRRLESVFAKMYESANTRFCICDNMERYYESLYKTRGEILYPFRGKDDVLHSVVNESRGVLRYCYSGSLFTGDFIPMLDEFAGMLEGSGDRLDIFSNMGTKIPDGTQHLGKNHVAFHSLIHPKELMIRMNQEMDVALLLNSFQWEEIFRYNFSSKLVDYSSSGLPVLFWGPSTSGTISWAKERGYDILVTDRNPIALNLWLRKLRQSDIRKAAADKIRQIGETFDYQPNFEKFARGISNKPLRSADEQD